MLNIPNNESSIILKRRIKIIVGYLILFGAISFFLYLMFSPDATCFDKIKNQGEKEVDCGGPCTPCRDLGQTKDLMIQEISFAPGGNDTYDVVAKIYNPNDSIGAKNFKYTFTLKDSTGSTMASREGTSFILPSDTRYLVQLELPANGASVPKEANIEISEAQWEKLSGIGKPQLGIYSKKFGANPIGNGNEVEGTVRNESGYDFKKIDITIVVRDENGRVIGINTTQRDSVRAKEEQKFNVIWPYPLEGNAQKIEVDPQVNIFDPQNFSIAE